MPMNAMRWLVLAPLCLAALACGRAAAPCLADTDAALCAARACGALAAIDNCGASRTIASCGACRGTGESCSAAGACACAPESDVALCSANARVCGALAAIDNCGASRTIASCGACRGTGESCSAAGACACAPETDAALCSANARACGALAANDNCGASRTIASCGACGGGTVCASGQCVACGLGAGSALSSCKAIHDACPTSGDGAYWINPGGVPAFRAFCDMSSEGGGWTLVARNDGTSGAHDDCKAVGSLVAPDQVTTAKLSDQTVNALAATVYKLSCKARVTYWDATSRPFDACSRGGENKRGKNSLNDPFQDLVSDDNARGMAANDGSIGMNMYYGYDPANTSTPGCHSNGWGGSGWLMAR